jgi:hypothetical protein
VEIARINIFLFTPGHTHFKGNVILAVVMEEEEHGFAGETISRLCL